MAIQMEHVYQHLQQHDDEEHDILREGDNRRHTVGGPVVQLGFVVLVMAYKGLRQDCTKMESNPVLSVFPLLLQLWSYEWYSIGWLVMDHALFDSTLDGEDGPTMGSLWCRRWVISLAMHVYELFNN